MARIRRGRKKISMEKMKNKNNLLVTFSKRRFGLFKKASEICTLCGVEVALIVFSPGQKVYSFGHPSVDAIVRRYFDSITNSSPLRVNQAHGVQYNAETIEQLNKQFNDLQDLLVIENARSKHFRDMKDNPQLQNWWDVTNKNQHNLQQLAYLKAMMENLHNVIGMAQQNIILEAQNRANMAQQPPRINPFDAQNNASSAPFPNPNVPPTGGVGPGRTNPGPGRTDPGPSDHHPN